MAALEAGRHVYTEKPLARLPMRQEDSGTMRERPEISCSFAPRASCCSPRSSRFARSLSSGELGVIRAARAQAFAGVPPWPGYLSDPSPYFEAGAGPLVDMGVYPLHVLTGLLGPVSSVAAMASTDSRELRCHRGSLRGQGHSVEAEDEWQLLARLGSCTASVEASFSTVGSAAADCELRGDRGAVAFSLFDVAAPISLRACRTARLDEPAGGTRARGGP